MQQSTTSSAPSIGYDPYQLSNLFNAGAAAPEYNDLLGQFQTQWLNQYGTDVLGQKMLPYKTMIDNHNAYNYTYGQNGSYSMSPMQLSTLYKYGMISGIDPRTGYTTGKMSYNFNPRMISSGTTMTYPTQR